MTAIGIYPIKVPVGKFIRVITCIAVGLTLAAAAPPVTSAVATDAERQARSALAIAEQADGPTSEAAAAALDRLAALLHDADRNPEALPLARRLVAIRQATRGADDGETIRAERLLGAVLVQGGDYAEGARAFAHARDAAIRTLGEAHDLSLALGDQLADALISLGEPQQAEIAARSAIAANERRAKPNPMLLAGTWQTLGAALSAAGRGPEATAALQKAIAIRVEQFGDSSVETAAAYDMMAVSLHDQRRFDEAERYARHGVGIWTRLAPETRNAAAAYMTMAMILFAQDQTQEAIEWAQKGMALQVAILGVDHPTTIATFANTAAIGDALGLYTTAEPLHRLVLEARLRRLGPNHPLTALTLGNLAVNLERQGKLDEAADFYRRSFDTYRRTLPDGHPERIAIAGAFGRMELRRRMHPREGIALIRQATDGIGARIGQGADPAATLRRYRSYYRLKVEAAWAAR